MGNMIAEVPSFGTNYTWRVIYAGKTSANSDGTFHHFSTLPWFNLDSSKSRLRVITNSGKFNGNYIFVDATKTMYDMRGRPVWFLPDKKVASSGNITVRDLKVTPSGSVTYLFGESAREVDYNGNTIWEGPVNGRISGDTAEHFHHELTKLSNAHYMVMGNETVASNVPYYHPADAQAPDASVIKNNRDSFLQKISFGTLIEYDSAGKVVWSWKSSAYFRTADLYGHYLSDGRFPVTDVHANAFFFDEKKKVIYVGFRNISRIVKIKYPQGNVLAVYGAKCTSGPCDICSDLFCGQHSIRVAANGDLYLFNNNAVAISATPQVLVLKETPGKDQLKKVWQYDCTLDGMSENELNEYTKKSQQMQMLGQRDSSMMQTLRLSSGGNAVELGDGSFLVTMSGVFGKIFVVNKNKEVLWSAVPEVKIFDDAPWTAIGSYRASMVTRRQLQALIWNTK